MPYPEQHPGDDSTYDPYAEYRETKPVHRQHRMEPRPPDGQGFGYPPQPTYGSPATPEQVAAQQAEQERMRQWGQWQDDVRRQAWADAQRHAAAQYTHPQYTHPQYNGPVQQVVVTNTVRAGGGCPHLLHFVLTAVTCGIWLPVWIIHAIVDACR
ncbi:MAG: hypothetical protein WAX14_22300 [Rhodococcus sp. (in: high G+C Gram-positive bacteria)]|uniref:hypothetical protein n=1 Tax=Rhodococcus sp. TaxID=1831 RepID=UPI003BB6E772